MAAGDELVHVHIANFLGTIEIVIVNVYSSNCIYPNLQLYNPLNLLVDKSTKLLKEHVHNNAICLHEASKPLSSPNPSLGPSKRSTRLLFSRLAWCLKIAITTMLKQAKTKRSVAWHKTQLTENNSSKKYDTMYGI